MRLILQNISEHVATGFYQLLIRSLHLKSRSRIWYLGAFEWSICPCWTHPIIIRDGIFSRSLGYKYNIHKSRSYQQKMGKRVIHNDWFVVTIQSVHREKYTYVLQIPSLRVTPHREHLTCWSSRQSPSPRGNQKTAAKIPLFFQVRILYPHQSKNSIPRSPNFVSVKWPFCRQIISGWSGGSSEVICSLVLGLT